MSETAAQRLLRHDARTAAAAAVETCLSGEETVKALLAALEPREAVRALYHDSWGYAALTDHGLVLLSGSWTHRVTRVPEPLRILRRAHGVLDSTEILVGGKPHRLWGSKIDPKGELLAARGELLPADSPLRPGRGQRFFARVRRPSVVLAAAAAVVFFAVQDPGSGGETAVARESVATPDRNRPTTLAVPDFHGDPLTTAVVRARPDAWRLVSAADASSADRPVKTTDTGWRVCFQRPSGKETVVPSATALTLYAVPEREKCPERLHGPRRAVMPDLVGERSEDALRALGELGFDHVIRFHAHTGKQLDDEPSDSADWRVCRQRPKPDTEVSTTAQTNLWLIRPGTDCTAPSPKPKPKPKPKPEPEPEPEPGFRIPEGFTTGSTSGGSTGGSTGSTGSTGGSSTGGSGGGTGGQTGVQFGQYCSPVGAIATTSDGRPAKCFMGKDGQARWGYNSG
ncbi:Stk1 family PASTA domain-containing Ser/Thr kinase [Streptomyces albus]|uniref:Stk1 family PASTA domain-containing Ser/Thr kinase n=1 Tax=Streptomyces albus TaxID=1888 RepID=UPI0004CA16BC|nr:Stk1 family PASTA domain-containing Ser/Thr kinase [Streptomyces albus]